MQLKITFFAKSATLGAIALHCIKLCSICPKKALAKASAFLTKSTLFVFLKFQNVAGVALQHIADGSQGREADGRHLVVFDFGKIDIGDSHTFRKFV